MAGRPLSGAVAGAAVALAAASCNLWPGELGQVDLPYTEAAARAVDRRSLELDAAAPPRSIEEGVEAIRARRPDPEGEAPAVVREAEAGPVDLSVAELRQLVLANNLDLEVALLDPEIARTRVSAEEGRFDALIGGRFVYADVETPDLDGALADLTSPDQGLDKRRVKLTVVEQRKELLDMGLGVTVPLPTGGKIALEGMLNQRNLVEPEVFEQYLAATRFSFSQPLLRNAGPDAATASIRLARVDQRISEVRTKLAALRILASAEKAYWRLYAARRFLDVRSEQFRLASENLELVRRRVAEGVTPRVEIVRAEVGFYKRVEALIIAETEWRLRQRDLKVQLASERFPLRQAPMIEVVTEPLLAGLELDAELLVRRALEERLELIELELGIVRDGIHVGFRENQILPIANLDFRYGILERDDSLGSAFSSQWDMDNQDVSVGLSFEIPFTNQRRRAQLDDALLTRARRLASRSARELAIREEVYDMVDVIGQNWQRIVAARQSVIVAGVNYDAERRQFEQGFRTMREVFEALADLGEAQLAEIRAIVDYQVAQVDLAFATGTLLGYARVDLSPLELPRAIDPD
jgi:outer membrane protein TolC